MPARYEQKEITQVKMLLLRENLHRPGKQANPSEKTHERTHRGFLIASGTNYPYDKGRALHRGERTPPFAKEPAGKLLIRMETLQYSKVEERI